MRKNAREIEVTPQMIQAGGEVLHESGEMHFDDPHACRYLAQRVLQAALNETDALQSARKK